MGWLEDNMPVIGGVSGLIGDVYNMFAGERNFNYMKDMQKKAWNREDTAIQRRMADMKAAGINPLLAAGSAAQSSSPVSTTAPQVKPQAAQMAMNMMQQKKNIELQEKNIDLADAQKDYVNMQKWETEMRGWQQVQALDERLYNWGKAKQYGIRSDISTGPVTELQQAVNALKAAHDGAMSGALLEVLQKAGVPEWMMATPGSYASSSRMSPSGGKRKY